MVKCDKFNPIAVTVDLLLRYGAFTVIRLHWGIDELYHKLEIRITMHPRCRTNEYKI